MVQQARIPFDVSRLIAGVELESIHCHEFNAAYVREIDHNLVRGIESSFQSETACRVAAERTHFDVRVKGTLSGAQPEQVGGDAPGELVRIVIVYELRYRLRNPPIAFTDDEAQAFGAINGVYHAWPFLREGLQDALNRLGLSGFLLPLLRLDSAPSPAQELQSAVRSK